MRDRNTAGWGGRLVVSVLSVMVISAGMPLRADAAIIGTETVLTAEARSASLERIGRVLASEAVRDRMVALGVDPADVQTRLASLTDAELASFADRLERAPAGAGALEVIGVVFLVILILEVVGIIDIFKTIGKAT